MTSPALRIAFYAALDAGDRRKAHRLARWLRDESTTKIERDRWSRWVRATRRGHRVKVSSFPVEVFAGRDLTDLETLRGADVPADLVEIEEEL